MGTYQIQLKVANFRAIKDADIILDGITVVTGENGSGKSTLSKFLYYVFKLSNEFEEYLVKDRVTQLENIGRFLTNVDRFLSEKEGWDSYQACREKELLDFIRSFKEKIEDKGKENDVDEKELLRLKQILIGILNPEKDENTIEELFDLVSVQVKNIFNDHKNKVQTLPFPSFFKFLTYYFPVKELPESFEVTELGAPVISPGKERIIKPYTIRQVAYADTPMLLDDKIYPLQGKEYWEDINKILYKRSNPGSETSGNLALDIQDVINGNASYETDKGKFTYKRNDGQVFNLLDCATGLKSFAMLQMMLENGFLNKYTLLIIDEPEAHLHPQWIVEYARLIVLLHKHIGVKFFIASHSPDMVRAIKYISEKEKVDNKLNFYFAKRNEPDYTYTYEHMGTDIETIFGSFNIALDKTDLYGSEDES